MTTFKYPETKFLSDSVNMPGGSKYTCQYLYKTKAGNYYISFEVMQKFTRQKVTINVPINCLSNKAELIDKLNAFTDGCQNGNGMLAHVDNDSTIRYAYEFADYLTKREFNKTGATNLKKLMTNIADEDALWTINETFSSDSTLSEIAAEIKYTRRCILEEMNSTVTLGPFCFKDFNGCNLVSDLTEFNEDSIFTFTTSIFAKRDACQYEVNFSDGKKVFLKKYSCDRMFKYLEKVDKPVHEETNKPVSFEL